MSGSTTRGTVGELGEFGLIEAVTARLGSTDARAARPG